MYSAVTITWIIEHKPIDLQVIQYTGLGIVLHTQFYTWGRWTISVQITVKLSEQQTSTYPFGVFLGTKLLHSAFENQREKKRERIKKKRGNTIQIMSIRLYHICDIKVYCELHTYSD